MTDIKGLVRSIGKKAFVDWLEECVKHHPDGHSLVTEKMLQKTGYTLKSCRSRKSKIYRIIRENLIDEACDDVINSTHKDITPDMKLKAKNLKKYAR